MSIIKDNILINDYLKSAGSLEELDKLCEADRHTTAVDDESAVKQQAMTAITNIREIQQIAHARIQADSRVTTAKVASGAEVCAAELSVTSKIARFQILHHTKMTSESKKKADHLILKVESEAKDKISAASRKAINEINDSASEAVDKIITTAKESVAQVQELVRETSEQAVEKLNTVNQLIAKQDNRSRTAGKIIKDSQDYIEESKKYANAAMKAIREEASLSEVTINGHQIFTLGAIFTTLSKSEVAVTGIFKNSSNEIREICKTACA